MTQHVTSLFALTGMTVLGNWSTAELQLAQALLIAGWLFFLRITAASGEDLDKLLGEQDECGARIMATYVSKAAAKRAYSDVRKARLTLTFAEDVKPRKVS